MRFAYADPPYLGCASYYGHLHPEAADYDRIETHRQLIADLGRFDGWALSLHTPSLKHLLPLCPATARVMAWVKPFASFKPSVRVAYAWEPVIVHGGRRRPRTSPTVRDWVAASITLKRGFVGAKPETFAYWLFEVLGAEPGDEFTDLFPGSGAVSRAWDAWRAQGSLLRRPRRRDEQARA
jgi:hypothetical protein